MPRIVVLTRILSVDLLAKKGIYIQTTTPDRQYRKWYVSKWVRTKRSKYHEGWDGNWHYLEKDGWIHRPGYSWSAIKGTMIPFTFDSHREALEYVCDLLAKESH